MISLIRDNDFKDTQELVFVDSRIFLFPGCLKPASCSVLKLHCSEVKQCGAQCRIAQYCKMVQYVAVRCLLPSIRQANPSLCF